MSLSSESACSDLEFTCSGLERAGFDVERVSSDSVWGELGSELTGSESEQSKLAGKLYQLKSEPGDSESMSARSESERASSGSKSSRVYAKVALLKSNSLRDDSEREG